MPHILQGKVYVVRLLSLMLAVLCLTSGFAFPPLATSLRHRPTAVESSQASTMNLARPDSVYANLSTGAGVVKLETGTLNIHQIALPTEDLVADPVTQKLYASVPARAGNIGNSILEIDAATGKSVTFVFVGQDPQKMAISDNGQYIYVALNGAPSVRRYDVAARRPDLQFGVGYDEFTRSYRVGDIAVQPGHPETIAVARLSSVFWGDGRDSGGVAVYDNGVARERSAVNTTTLTAHFLKVGGNVIEFSASPSVLYGFATGKVERSEFGFTKMVVAPCGVTVSDIMPSDIIPLALSRSDTDFRIDNGRAYANRSGRVFDPETGAPFGRFSLPEQSGAPPLVLPDSRANRVYFVTGDGSALTLRVFDMTTFLPIETLSLDGVSGTAESLVRWGANGLAFRAYQEANGTKSNERVVLLESDAVGVPSGNFTPAPTPVIPATTVEGFVFYFVGRGSRHGLLGATVSLTGAGIAVTTRTDGFGNYSFKDLPSCASYTVRVSTANHGIIQKEISNVVGTNTVDFRFETGGFNIFPESIGFSTNQVVAEGHGAKIEVALMRRPFPMSVPPGAASVFFETISGTASDKSDYTPVCQRVFFAPGELQKNVAIFITDDAFVEDTESFTIRLSDAVGVQLDGISILPMYIHSDDIADGINPVKDDGFNSEFFVRQHYLDFFNREPDADGLAFWTNEIDSCATQECRDNRRQHVSAAFLVSVEFEQTGYLVYRFHQAAFDTGERLLLKDFLTDIRAVGHDIVVGHDGWEQQLESNKQTYGDQFVNRPAFLARYPETMPEAEFVVALNANARSSLSPAERNALVLKLTNKTLTRAQVLREVVEDVDFIRHEFNRAFVLMQYFGYLRRNPNEAPEATLDFTGYNFWLRKMEQFKGDYIAAEMVEAFITSSEYQQRFGR